MNHRLTHPVIAALAALLILSAWPAQAGDQQPGPLVPKRCVTLTDIDHTRVVNDNDILFYMRGGTIYRNHLPHRCPGLKIEDTFLYRTSLPELCNVDIITVLNDIGSGFLPGASCGLGMFNPVSEEQAKALIAGPGLKK